MSEDKVGGGGGGGGGWYIKILFIVVYNVQSLPVNVQVDFCPSRSVTCLLICFVCLLSFRAGVFTSIS